MVIAAGVSSGFTIRGGWRYFGLPSRSSNVATVWVMLRSQHVAASSLWLWSRDWRSGKFGCQAGQWQLLQTAAVKVQDCVAGWHVPASLWACTGRLLGLHWQVDQLEQWRETEV